MYSYDRPLVETVDLADAQTAIITAAATNDLNSVSILGASAIVGATPAACVISIGDGTTADKYGVINVAAGGTANKSAVVDVVLTDDGYKILNQPAGAVVKFTNTTAPAAALLSLKIILGHY